MKTAAFPRVSKPKSRRARVVAILALSSLAWVSFTCIRVRGLLRNGAEIGAQNRIFSRDYAVGNSKSAPLLYIVMGDSTAAGWGATQLEGTYPYRVARAVAARGYHVSVVNIAVGGARLEDVRRLQLPQLEALRPDFISLSAGANDATHFTSEAELTRELHLILAAMLHNSAREIFIANTPDMALAPALPLPLSIAVGRQARRQNIVLQQVFRDDPRFKFKIRLVDLFRLGKLDSQRDPSLYAADLFHPSASGYKVWAEVFERSLNKSDAFASR